jgi:multisubunit Na+/H+ antiporter MnhB subunit
MVKTLWKWFADNTPGLATSGVLGIAITVLFYILYYRFEGVALTALPLLGIWVCAWLACWVVGFVSGWWKTPPAKLDADDTASKNNDDT